MASSRSLLVPLAVFLAALHEGSSEPRYRFRPFHLPHMTMKVTQFKLVNLGSESDPVKLENVTVTSSKGVVTVGGVAVVEEQLDSPIKAVLVIHMQPGAVHVGPPITMPCSNNIGSCTYDDLCDFGVQDSKQCPAFLEQLGFPCSCPIPPGDYTLKDMSFPLGKLGPLAMGHFQISAHLIHINKTLAHYSVDFSIAA